VDNEQRELEIRLNAAQANASIKDMDAAVALLRNQLRKMADDDPRREQLKKDFQELKSRVKAANTDLTTYVETEEQARAAAERLNQENAQVILNGKKVSASFNEMDAAAKKLEAQLNDLAKDHPGRKQMVADYQDLQDRIEGVKKEMGSAQEESSVFKEALAFAGVTVGAEAVLEGIKELGAEIINTTKEVATLRGNINTLTGATGAELDGLTTSVLAVSRSFGKDFNEVLQASNTLSKQMGVSQQEAMRLIQQGFLAGADAGGDFLDQVKEYAPQFKDAGFAAQDFIGHISQSATQGIFSDKGADVVKEFGLRIREQTKATTEAMQAAFGSDFTKEIFDGINNGAMTVEQALQRVGKELDETKIPASQLQTVIADVFGGPGEDAGIDYLKSLKNVGKGVDELVDKTNVYTQRQQRLLASETELAEAQNDLTKEFEGGSTVLDTLSNKSLTLLYSLLASLGATFKELFEPVQEIWKSLTDLAEAMGWVSTGTLSAKSAGEALGNIIRLLFAPTKMLWGVIADVVKATVEWAKTSDVAKAFLQELTRPIRDLFSVLSNAPAYFAAFSAAADTSFSSVGRAWRKVKDGDFKGAGSEFANLGTKVGDAYRLAFEAAVAKKAAAKLAAPEQAEDAPQKRAQGGDGQTDAAREKAAKDAQKAREKAYKERKAARDKADQEHLGSLKQWITEEGALLDGRNTLARQRDQVALTDQGLRRQEQQVKIFAEAEAQVQKLTGLELDYTEQVAAIMEARDLRLRELKAKSAEEDEKARQAELDKKIASAQADEQVELAELDLQLANQKLTQQEHDEWVYMSKQAAMDRELALIREKSGVESAEYKKLLAEKLKEQAAHTTKAKALDNDVARFKKGLAGVEKVLNDDNVQALEESLGKQTLLYKAFKIARKADAVANIGINLYDEIQNYWKTAATMGPIAGPVYGIGLSTLATVRAGMAVANVVGYAKGGATGEGARVSAAGMGQWGTAMRAATGMGVASNGKLVDAQGLEVAGIVHKNEYVIPEWMRQDPEVLQVENWLEARRQRGFVEGGPTTAGERRPAATELPTDPAEASQLVQVLASLDQRLARVEEWPTQLNVVLDLLGLARAQEKIKQVQSRSEIRPK
jgi:phage-related minor tail protein